MMCKKKSFCEKHFSYDFFFLVLYHIKMFLYVWGIWFISRWRLRSNTTLMAANNAKSICKCKSSAAPAIWTQHAAIFAFSIISQWLAQPHLIAWNQGFEWVIISQHREGDGALSVPLSYLDPLVSEVIQPWLQGSGEGFALSSWSRQIAIGGHNVMSHFLCSHLYRTVISEGERESGHLQGNLSFILYQHDSLW